MGKCARCHPAAQTAGPSVFNLHCKDSGSRGLRRGMTACATYSTLISLIFSGATMSYTTWETIAETPWWVFFMISFMMYIAYVATKPRYLHVKSELIMQGASLFLLSLIVTYYVPFSLDNLGLLFLGLILGYVIGKAHFHFRKIQAIEGHFIVYLPGSWYALLIVPLVIFLKFWYFGTNYTIDLDLLHTALYQHWLSGLSGFSFGLYFGRTSILLRCLRTGPYTEAPYKTN